MSKAIVIKGADFSANALGQITFGDPVPCTGITLNKSTTELGGVGETETLTASVTPVDTTDTITWASSDTSVATVSNGVITAVGLGTATITATCGNYSATCTVAVRAMLTGVKLAGVYAGGDTKVSSGNGVGTLSPHANFGSIVAESGTLKCADYNSVNYYPIPIPAGTTKLKITYTDVSSTRVAHINWFNSQVQSVDGYAQLVGRTDSGLTGASVVEVSIPTFSGYTFDSCNICILSTGFVASDFDKVTIEFLTA